ncbi:hypothetical protein [Pseudomonas sp. RGM 3321]|uniref:hypothetical protein n=1 Tax=Pseudomonas sp. RGM 3321 TaxID=2930089 RepID=UPI001FCC87A9|nr:hypothetical protein [Pseudomonas sp. RGM 3321]MCJ2374996.1 hypothetical protein [Pseudomonas sp. RGM 3321]
MKNPDNNVMWGWDSIAAMARGKVNNLLLQEYIARFSSNAYLKPVSGEVILSEGFKENIHNFILDAPRLAFSNDKLGQSHATLTCSILGGTQLTMKNNVDNWEAYRVIHIDALQGPKLTLDLALERVPGIVQSDGRVRLDLKDSDNFILTFAADRADRVLGGAFFKVLFNALPDEERIWTLGVIKRGSPNNLMHPQSFKLRTQTNPAAPLDPHAANYGDGAVLVFIRLEGSQEGGNIPVEYQYLIPDDVGKDYSATVLFSAERTFKAAVLIGEVMTAISSIFDGLTFRRVHDASGRLIKATASSGIFITSQPGFATYPVRVDGVTVTAELWSAGTQLDAAGKKPLSVEIDDEGRAVLTWTAEAQELVILTVPGYDTPALTASKVVTVVVTCAYTFAEYANDLVLRPSLAISTTSSEVISKSNPGASLSVAALIFTVGANFATLNAQRFEASIRDTLKRDLEANVPISAFIRESIDLNFNEAIVPDVLRAPRDIAAFGRIKSSGADFVVSPAEHLMVVDSSTTFSIQPPGANVMWSVERLQGDAQNFGAINGTGRYYAPEASLTELAFTRVRVTATDMNSNYRSSALVTILTNPITVNPLIQVCDARQIVELEAGSLGTEEIHWSLKDPVPGESGVLEGSALAGGDHRYVAVHKVPGKNYVLDQIVVTSGQASVSSWVLVKHQTPLITVKVLETVEVSEVLQMVRTVKVVRIVKGMKVVKVLKIGTRVDVVTIRADQVQLQAFANGITLAGVKWRIGAGSGSISEGLYTPDISSTDRFVLIFAEAPHPVFDVIAGHIILPLPMDRFATELQLMKGQEVQAS